MLKELKWPTPLSSSSHTQDLWNKCHHRFTELFNLLLELGTPPPPVPPHGHHGPPHGHHDPEGCPPRLHDPVVLPINVLLDPLKKRFQFHFYGNKKTNMKEKVCFQFLYGTVLKWVCLCSQSGTSLKCPPGSMTTPTLWRRLSSP